VRIRFGCGLDLRIYGTIVILVVHLVVVIKTIKDARYMY